MMGVFEREYYPGEHAMASTAQPSPATQDDATAQLGRIRPQSNYTEEKLRPAVAASQTLSEVLARLGLPDSPDRRRYLSDRIKALRIDGSRLRSSSMLYTDAQLAEAVATSKTMVEVALKIGAKPMGGTIYYLKRRITALGVDTSHLRRPREAQGLRPEPTSSGFQRDGRRLVVDEELLRAAVPRCTSIAEVIRELGLEPTGGRHRAVGAAIKRLGLDTAHFLGAAHRRGSRSNQRLAPEAVLVFRPEQQYRGHVDRIKRALLELGVPDRCVMCGTGPQWQGLPMSLEVDHINGDFRDNRRENLRLLCPNCHATTNTFCRRKRVG